MAKGNFGEACKEIGGLTSLICKACELNCEFSMYKVPEKETKK